MSYLPSKPQMVEAEYFCSSQRALFPVYIESFAVALHGNEFPCFFAVPPLSRLFDGVLEFEEYVVKRLESIGVAAPERQPLVGSARTYGRTATLAARFFVNARHKPAARYPLLNAFQLWDGMWLTLLEPASAPPPATVFPKSVIAGADPPPAPLESLISALPIDGAPCSLGQ
jgi:hypothetical protein